MKAILQAGGAPQRAIDRIQEIIDTCRACRMWELPSPKSAATSRLVEAFNKIVQHDLMFVSPRPGQQAHTKGDPRAEPWQHVIDCCNRLSQACILPNKTTHELIRSFELLWVRPYGPPLTIESDQESGLVCDEAKMYFSRLGTELKIKGVDAHAKMAERHHDLLRTMYLRIVAQAQEEGIEAPKDLLLTAALTAKNSLLTVGSSTPLASTLGQQPPLLPDIDQPPSALDDSHTGPDGYSRGRHRIREIATQSCVEASAVKRMQEAANSKTRPCAQAKDLAPGQEIEFFRKPAQKDTQGWRGPAELCKLDDDGTCHIKWQGTTLTCRLQDVRKALTYHILMHYIYFKATDNQPLDFLIDHVMRMLKGTQQTIAILPINGVHTMSNSAKRNYKLFNAILHVATVELQLTDCVGARLAHGIQHLTGITQIPDSLLTWWPHSRPEQIHYQHTPASHAIDCRKLQHNIPATQLCICQFLCTTPEDTAVIQQTFPDVPNIGPTPMDIAAPHPALSPLIPTIPPPQQPGNSDPNQSAAGIIQSAAQAARKRTRDRADSDNPAPHCSPCLPPEEEFDEPLEPTSPIDVPIPDDDELDDLMHDVDDNEELLVEPDTHTHLDTPYPPEQITLDQYNATTTITQQDVWFLDDGFTPDCNDDFDNVEIELGPEMAHWSGLCEQQLQPDEVLVLIANKKRVTAVIQWNCDNLNAHDQMTHKVEVDAAKLDELRRWYDLKGFRRGSRATASNIVDGTWVIKWKKVKGTDSSGKEVWRRVVRARLTARGFRDLQAFQENIETFSGTATKAAQRTVCGITAQHGFTLFSMDISAAFLKGLTFQEIADLTGKPFRSVQFHVPKDSVHILRQLPGLHDFDPHTEILEFLKSIWGLKDAPRAFGMRRDQTLRSFGAQPTNRDPHLWVKRTRQGDSITIVCVFSTHLDDVKGGATDKERELLATVLRKVFGDDLKVEIGNLEFTGVKHSQAIDKSIHCHQDHYVQELSMIPLDNITHLKDDEPAPQAETEAFGSLLGGLGWLLVTRADICAFVTFLQRLARKPLIRHITMINKVLRYCKRHSAGITYHKLEGTPYLLCIADSAYQSNEDRTDCIALRGYFVFLACRPNGTSNTTLGGKVQLLDFLAKKLSVISRSAFAAELRNTLEAAQDAINHAVLLHEVYRGPFTAEQCADIRDKAAYFLDIVICTDNQGLYNGLTKEDPTPGSDGSMVYHVKALRELLDQRHISSVAWLDNRDMVADGLTKGKPSRDDINQALSTGKWSPNHEFKIWSSTTKRNNS